MSTSVTFYGAGFEFEQATALRPGVVRVRFTSDPKQSNPVLSTDGLNPNNYVLTGVQSAPAIASIAPVTEDPQSLDLILVSALALGFWTVTVSNVQSVSGVSLTAPYGGTFEVSDISNATDLSAGASNDDPARVIRQHLSPAMVGPNWDALIEGLSRGDDVNWNNARLAFDQLFKSTASGKYLDRLAANDGLTRPPGVGMSDDLFRQLAIKLNAGKVTHESLREILEVFYGRSALRAWVDTELGEPFVLGTGLTLEWALDETQTFQATFWAGPFQNIYQARAQEVAGFLTQVMREAGSQGQAVAVTDPETGLEKVRIYSGSLGLGSFVRVTGGTAQPVLKFSESVNTYSGEVDVGDGYSWTYSAPRPGVTRLQLVTALSPLVTISGVEPGDYLVIGSGVGNITSGSYEILDAGYTVSGSFLTQWVELDADLGYSGSITQTSSSNYQFFRPLKRSILSSDRTVVVAQTERSKIDIRVPATTQAVNRGPHSGAYGNGGSEIGVSLFTRSGEGVATITTDYNHDLQTGDLVLLDGFRAAPARPQIASGASGSPNHTGGSWGTCFSETVPVLGLATSRSVPIQLLNGDVLIIGGVASGVYQADCKRLRFLGPDGVISGQSPPEANGAPRFAYEWLATASTYYRQVQHAASRLTDGSVIVSGGFNTSLGYGVKHCERYDPNLNTWTEIPSLIWEKYGHQQLTLSTGRVIVIGGAYEPSTSWPYVEAFDPDIQFWTWDNLAQMSQKRYQHRAVVLQSGIVMVTGGRPLGADAVAGPGTTADSAGQCLDSVEFYNPTTNTWSAGPRMTWGRFGHNMTVLADGRVLVYGGLGRDKDQPLPVVDSPTWSNYWPNQPIFDTEIYDPGTGRWYPGERLSVGRLEAMGVYLPETNQIWYTGGQTFGGPIPYGSGPGSTIPAADATAVFLLDGNRMTWSRSLASFNGKADSATHIGSGIVFGTGGTGDNTKALFWLPGAETVSAAGLNGWNRVSERVSDTVFKIETPETPFAACNYGTSGPDYIEWFPGAKIMASKALSLASGAPGPFILDPDAGLPVTATQSPLTVALRHGAPADRLTVTSTTGFPDGQGYVVLDFGGPNQSPPLKYLETLGTTVLLLEYGQKVPADYPVGTKVVLLSGRTPFVPETVADTGLLYATGSSIGRIAAQTLTESAAAAGIQLDFKVVYPGAQGLGSEGQPTTGAGKLSDAVWVWGGDE